jgi:hypothetical protein
MVVQREGVEREQARHREKPYLKEIGGDWLKTKPKMDT